jgi:hypothetical protein
MPFDPSYRNDGRRNRRDGRRRDLAWVIVLACDGCGSPLPFELGDGEDRRGPENRAAERKWKRPDSDSKWFCPTCAIAIGVTGEPTDYDRAVVAVRKWRAETEYCDRILRRYDLKPYRKKVEDAKKRAHATCIAAAKAIEILPESTVECDGVAYWARESNGVAVISPVEDEDEDERGNDP